MPLALSGIEMPPLQIVETWAEGFVRIGIGAGLAWIGAVEGAGYGLFLQVVGVVFITAGIGEIWAEEAAAVRRSRLERTVNGVHPALVECQVPVFYATTEGQTRRIAERLVAIFRDNGLTSRAIDVASSDADWIDWPHVRAAVVGASLHAGRHQRSAEAFVCRHAADLNERPSAFFSVSLATASQHPAERHAAARLAAALPEGAGWRPGEITCLAGRLAYTRYGLFTRVVMKWIARRQGAPTNTSRDYEFTNREEVARLAGSVAARIAQGKRRAA